ncbi:Methylated-DNA--protein-cysteine methyltransferase [Aureliella helgolandensis]|uniref:methylated-DNA--[protein]-cysteine S-methyltransferase n=2 Tax=Aureliella helgolandensis TaxID=2527968 RepID=A0A518G7J8_9BACT|nr:Methylated-DNA--protein-cysteine methyltransferase [Aureliella helgolandensis]
MEAEWTSQGLYRCEFQSRSAVPPLGLVVDQPPVSDQARREGESEENPLSQPATVHQARLGLEKWLATYFETGVLQWEIDWFDWSGVSPFHRKALTVCFEIPSGQVLTYGEVASRCGSPQAARAVGGAMARNRWPLIIPCHRVMGAGGQLTGYSGSGGVDTKQALLSFERERAASSRRNGSDH